MRNLTVACEKQKLNYTSLHDFFHTAKCMLEMKITTVLPAKSDSEIMFGLKTYQGLRIDRSLVY